MHRLEDQSTAYVANESFNVWPQLLELENLDHMQGQPDTSLWNSISTRPSIFLGSERHKSSQAPNKRLSIGDRKTTKPLRNHTIGFIA